MQSVNHQRDTNLWSFRTQVVAVFREIGNGRDEKTAYKVTKDWYRWSGGDWTNYLS